MGLYAKFATHEETLAAADRAVEVAKARIRELEAELQALRDLVFYAEYCRNHAAEKVGK